MIQLYHTLCSHGIIIDALCQWLWHCRTPKIIMWRDLAKMPEPNLTRTIDLTGLAIPSPTPEHKITLKAKFHIKIVVAWNNLRRARVTRAGTGWVRPGCHSPRTGDVTARARCSRGGAPGSTVNWRPLIDSPGEPWRLLMGFGKRGWRWAFPSGWDWLMPV